MAVDIKVTGHQQFRDVAKALKAAGHGGLVKELNKGLKKGLKPVVDEAKANVTAVKSAGMRGGASARQTRREFALAKKKKVTDRMKASAARRSGLRSSVARTVTGTARASSRRSSLIVKSEGKRMPPQQQGLPRSMNEGRWRHPVFGNRDKWATQTATPVEWFDRAGREKGPAAVEGAIEQVASYLDKLV